MKRLFATSLTDVDKADKDGVGTLRYERYGVYRYVRNKHGSALTIGAVASHAFSDLANFNEKVYDGNNTDLAAMAGIVMGASLTEEYYGWIQVFGYAASVQIGNYQETGTIVAGAVLIPENGTQHAVVSTAMNTDIKYRRQLILLEAVTSTIADGTLKKAYVHCL